MALGTCPHDGASEMPAQPQYVLEGWTETAPPVAYPIRLAELHVYGNAAQGRIGMSVPGVPRDTIEQTNDVFVRRVRLKHYELKEHLGNVRVAIGDQASGAL